MTIIKPPPRKTYHPTRLRQIALLTTSPKSLAHTQHLLTSIFAAPLLFVDPAVGQWGLQNFLVPLGGDVIEVVAPFRPDTTAGRLLERRGEGGYMIIMQTASSQSRCAEAEAAGAKVIWSHDFKTHYDDLPAWKGIVDKGTATQYHPKGIPGGMMPELDSHEENDVVKDPVGERFGPWHAAGKEYGRYGALMRGVGDLYLKRVVLCLGKGGVARGEAVKVWSGLFGIPVVKGRDEERGGVELGFTNCQMGFVEGDREGLVSLTVGVEGRKRLEGIRERARREGVWKGGDEGWLEIVGVRWYLELMEDSMKAKL